MDKLEDLSKEELIKRVRLSADISLALDGLWFLAAENTNGYDKALEMDIDVWERYVPVAVKRIKKHFDLPSTGLQGIKDIVKYDPLWIGLDMEFLEDAPERLVFQVNRCPALEAMERIGRELLTCQPVEGAYLSKLAETMDPRIKVEPLKLPPRESPDEICCQWLFSLE
jgi:hypothetical protein